MALANTVGNLPDFIEADVTNLKAVEGTSLRQMAEPLSFPLSEEDKNLVEVLVAKYSIKDALTASLSAPQLGAAKRVIVFSIPPEVSRQTNIPELPTTVLINPYYEQVSDEMVEDVESCFSVKNTVGRVMRYGTIRYWGQDPTGRMVEGEARGYVARLIQHEVDHLNGRLFIDLVTKDKLTTMRQFLQQKVINEVLASHGSVLKS